MIDILEQIGFKDVEFGAVQTDDEMTVVPIIGANRTENVASPDSVRFEGTSDYGSMKWENEDEARPAIIPSNSMVLTTDSAQDHAMSKAGVVSAGTDKTFDDSCCVEETQGGYMRAGRETNEFGILPVEISKALFASNKRYQNQYDKAWEFIRSFMKKIPQVKDNQAHISYFFRDKEIMKELDQFTAAFEPVSNQIGSMVFFHKTLIGFEIMPNHEHWLAYWNHLIRYRYGSQLVKERLSGNIKRGSLIIPDFKNNSILDEANKFLASFKDTMVDIADSIRLKSFVNRETASLITSTASLDTGGGGDVILEGVKPIYLSLVV